MPKAPELSVTLSMPTKLAAITPQPTVIGCLESCQLLLGILRQYLCSRSDDYQRDKRAVMLQRKTLDCVVCNVFAAW